MINIGAARFDEPLLGQLADLLSQHIHRASL